MKAVMYHYVRGGTDRQPDYYHLNVEDFRRQLDYFEDNFGFVTKEDFLRSLRGEGESIPRGILLTFDDGMRDHYDVVFPELRKRGLWGTFYVPTGPYETGRLLDVHRTHVLLGKVSGEDLLENAQDIVDEEMIPHERQDEYREETYKTQDDSEPTKQAKRILNFFVADEYQTEVLDRLTERMGCDMPSVSDFYMTTDELREMHNNGMVIGGHTVTHPVLSKLNKEGQMREVTESFDYLDKAIGGLSERTFCYPYGHEYSFDGNTVSILSEAGCEWCFKVEPSDIESSDVVENPLALPRYDCTEFRHGESSGSVGSSS